LQLYLLNLKKHKMIFPMVYMSENTDANLFLLSILIYVPKMFQIGPVIKKL